MAFTSKEIFKDLQVFIRTTVQSEELKTDKSIETALQILKDIFSRINIHEPRFSSNLVEENGRVKGLHEIGPKHLELRVYLDQLELFDIVETSAPKAATFLDIKDESSKVVCVWSDFLTAPGHLSAKKLRDRFQIILNQTVTRATWSNRNTHVAVDKSQPRLKINRDIVVDIYPAFKVVGFWPDQGRRDVFSINGRDFCREKIEIDLISKPIGCAQPYSTDRDAWKMDFMTMENAIINEDRRELCFSIANTIIRRCLKPRSAVFDSAVIRTAFLYVCEKHTNDKAWTSDKFPERINSVLLQLVASLQSRCLPHFYLSKVNILEDRSSIDTTLALNEAWKLAREFCTNKRFFKTK